MLTEAMKKSSSNVLESLGIFATTKQTDHAQKMGRFFWATSSMPIFQSTYLQINQLK